MLADFYSVLLSEASEVEEVKNRMAYDREKYDKIKEQVSSNDYNLESLDPEKY